MAAFGTAGRLFGGFAIDRDVFRTLLPDQRVYLYAAGLINPGDGNIATISLVYHKDDNTTVTLLSTTKTGATQQKWTLGPVSMFDAAGVREAIPVVYLKAQKNAGADGQLMVGCIYPRLIPSGQ